MQLFLFPVDSGVILLGLPSFDKCFHYLLHVTTALCTNMTSLLLAIDMCCDSLKQAPSFDNLNVETQTSHLST